MTLNQAFAIRVRQLLKEKGKTQHKLENETGIYHSTMTAILGNKVIKKLNFITSYVMCFYYTIQFYLLSKWNFHIFYIRSNLQ